MHRTLLLTGAVATAMILGSTLAAEAGGPHHHTPYPQQASCGPVGPAYPYPQSYGYARPRPVYSAPIYPAPVYPAPVVVPSYPAYSYRPYPAYGYGRPYGGSGFGLNTNDFSLWIGR